MSCQRLRKSSLLLPEEVIERLKADYAQRSNRHQPFGDFVIEAYFAVPEYLRDRILNKWVRRYKRRFSEEQMLEIVLTHYYREQP